MDLGETTVNTQDTHNKIPLASIFGKRLDLAFDGGILTSDSGVLLLREVAKTAFYPALHRQLQTIVIRVM